ncbi:hypothetical protein [Atlantibacter hermannii]|uniref:hypothetical protein n=1 Tax=Atlantibacter hermannii TaxID=565 RepID=UPI00289B44BC|nr:hypothetical protein [Atlantibacter hermannii]MDU1949913.1 hypothetical protein [Atlantibacter hermannii]MDW4575584.1 hypothetical protein [Atlantibacter hermannii]MEB7923252.1 hypothetical protein [Atlantibacter hermannii]
MDMHIEGPFAFYQKPSQNRQQKAKKNRQRTDGKMLAWIDLFPVIIKVVAAEHFAVTQMAPCHNGN